MARQFMRYGVAPRAAHAGPVEHRLASFNCFNCSLHHTAALAITLGTKIGPQNRGDPHHPNKKQLQIVTQCVAVEPCRGEDLNYRATAPPLRGGAAHPTMLDQALARTENQFMTHVMNEYTHWCRYVRHHGVGVEVVGCDYVDVDGEDVYPRTAIVGYINGTPAPWVAFVNVYMAGGIANARIDHRDRSADLQRVHIHKALFTHLQREKIPPSRALRAAVRANFAFANVAAALIEGHIPVVLHDDAVTQMRGQSCIFCDRITFESSRPHQWTDMECCWCLLPLPL